MNISCPNCDKDIEPGYTFCPYCRAPLDEGKAINAGGRVHVRMSLVFFGIAFAVLFMGFYSASMPVIYIAGASYIAAVAVAIRGKRRYRKSKNIGALLILYSIVFVVIVIAVSLIYEFNRSVDLLFS